MRIFTPIIFLFSCFLLTNCGSKKHKNITFIDASTSQEQQPTLNIFTPKNAKKNNPVLIFVHGGNWNTGDKKMYGFLGRNFAKKGITTVIAGYTLSPQVSYDVMAKQVAKAVEWTKANIQNYNGDPNAIFLTGHSAGGHLVALVATNPKYLQDKSIIKGVILNDAAALDMNHYLEQYPPTEAEDYLATWTNNPENWKDASPIFFLNKKTPPFMIYLGSKTYLSIKVANTRFLAEIKQYQPNLKPIVLDKKHIPMVTQYIFPWSKRFGEIMEFMENNR